MSANVPSAFSDDEEALLTDINVTPLVDVVLVLLIVFMLTVPAIVGNAKLNVDLPESGSGETFVEAIPMDFILRREDSGEIVLYLNELPTDEESIRGLLADLGGPQDDHPASLAADKSIPYGEVVTVLDLLSSLGIKNLSLEIKKIVR